MAPNMRAFTKPVTGLGGLFEGNCPHFGAPGKVFRAMTTDELRQRMDGAETQIAGGSTAATLGFQMFEKAAHQKRGQILYGEPIDRSASRTRHERKQQNKCVPVAALGIARQIALGDQMLEQKAANSRSDQRVVTHGTAPVGRSVRSAGWPHAVAPGSW